MASASQIRQLYLKRHNTVNIICLSPVASPIQTTGLDRCTKCCKVITGFKDTHICTKCGTTSYCSQVCLLDSWIDHRKACGKLSGLGSPPPVDSPTGLQWYNHPFFAASPPEAGGINDLHTLTRYAVVHHVGLDAQSWLNSQSSAVVYSQIIDAYRVRMQEENGVYPGVFPHRNYQPIPHFNEFLEFAVRQNCLPGWWHELHTYRTLKIAMMEDGSACVLRPVTASELRERYSYDGGDWKRVVTQLRRIAKQVYGCEASRPLDPHFLEGLPYVRRSKEWGVVDIRAVGSRRGGFGSLNWSYGG